MIISKEFYEKERTPEELFTDFNRIYKEIKSNYNEVKKARLRRQDHFYKKWFEEVRVIVDFLKYHKNILNKKFIIKNILDDNLGYDFKFIVNDREFEIEIANIIEGKLEKKEAVALNNNGFYIRPHRYIYKIVKNKKIKISEKDYKTLSYIDRAKNNIHIDRINEANDPVARKNEWVNNIQNSILSKKNNIYKYLLINIDLPCEIPTNAFKKSFFRIALTEIKKIIYNNDIKNFKSENILIQIVNIEPRNFKKIEYIDVKGDFRSIFS